MIGERLAPRATTRRERRERERRDRARAKF